MKQIQHIPLRILRLKEIQARSGECRSGIYKKIADGLFTKAVHIGARSVGWPEHEEQAILAARISGQSDGQIRKLVASLEAGRADLFNQSASSIREMQQSKQLILQNRGDAS